MPLYTVIVDLGAERWRVRSGLGTRPVAGDRIRYGGLLELDVRRVVLEVGVGGDIEVLTAPSLPVPPRPDLEETLTTLRFRREAQDDEPAPVSP